MVTTKPLDVPTAAQYGGAYTRGGLKSSEPMAMDGSVYADKAVSWAAKYAGGSTVVYPAGLKWKPRFLWKGYSISKMTEKKGTAMRALGWDLGKSVNKVGGGHFEEPILGGGHGAATRTRYLYGLSGLPGPSDFVRSVAQLCSGPGPRPRGDGAWVVAAPRHGLRRGHRDGLRPMHVRVHGLRSGLLVALGECHGAEVRVLR